VVDSIGMPWAIRSLVWYNYTDEEVYIIGNLWYGLLVVNVIVHEWFLDMVRSTSDKSAYWL